MGTLLQLGRKQWGFYVNWKETMEISGNWGGNNRNFMANVRKKEDFRQLGRKHWGFYGNWGGYNGDFLATKEKKMGISGNRGGKNGDFMATRE